MPTTSNDIVNDYPLPTYRFNVDFGGDNIAFAEVSGLELELQPITYRDGLGAKYMPGMEQPVKLTLKKGVVQKVKPFFDWISTIHLNRVDKKDITISLIDGDPTKPLVSWSVVNAFPVKLSAPTMDAKSNEIAVESLELMADSFTVISA